MGAPGAMNEGDAQDSGQMDITAEQPRSGAHERDLGGQGADDVGAAAAASVGRSDGSEERPQPDTSPAPGNSFIFLTNRHNLLEVLSSRMISAREVYGDGKYYPDLLEQLPWGVPVFRASAVGSDLTDLVVEPDVVGSFPVIILLAESADLGRPVATAPDGELYVPAGPVPLDGVQICFRTDGELDEHKQRPQPNFEHSWFEYVLRPELFSGPDGLARLLEKAPRRRKFVRSAAYVADDKYQGALSALAALVRLHEQAGVHQLASLLGAADDGQVPVSGWPTWLQGDFLRADKAKAGWSADARALTGFAAALRGVTPGTGLQTDEVLNRARAVAMSPRAAKQVVEDLERSFECAGQVLSLKRDMVVGDPEIPVAAVRAGMHALLSRSVDGALSQHGDRLWRDPEAGIGAVALAGVFQGRKRMSAELRQPDALDRWIADTATARLRGEGGDALLEVIEATRADGSRDIELVAGGEVILKVVASPPSLAHLLRDADLAVDPGKSVARELARAISFEECIQYTLFINGPFETAWDSAKKRIAISFAGRPEQEFTIDKDPLLKALADSDLAPEREEELKKPLLPPAVDALDQHSQPAS